MSDKEVFIYVDLEGVSHKIGRLWAHSQRGAETATFKYDDKWLANEARFLWSPPSPWLSGCLICVLCVNLWPI